MDLYINSKNAKKDGLYSQSQDPWVEEEHGSYFPNISKMVSSVPNIMTNPHLDSTK